MPKLPVELHQIPEGYIREEWTSLRELQLFFDAGRYRIFVPSKSSNMKKIISTGLLALVILFSAKAQKSSIYVEGGKAINGYDPVAFFTASKPVMGRDSLMFQWNGAAWYFADRANLEAFKTTPEKYAPQYGGYCAYGTSQGHKAPTQVDTWSVVDGKLYFNYNQKVKTAWMKDRPALIKKADEVWPTLKNKE